MDLSWCFPFDLTMKLLFEERIIWTHKNPIYYGAEVINENILQKSDSYQLIIEIDGKIVSNNFMVTKKQ